jgi:hypothetical protein
MTVFVGSDAWRAASRAARCCSSFWSLPVVAIRITLFSMM